MDSIGNEQRLEITDLGTRIDYEFETPGLLGGLSSSPKSIP